MGGKTFICAFCLLALFYTSSLSAQDLRYSVMWRGDSVGHVLAFNYDSAEYNVYRINSEVSFWLLGRKTINYDYLSLYKDDVLVQALTRYTRNGDVKAESTVFRNGKGYEVTVDGDQRLLTDPNPIDYSVTTIYYNEPVSHDNIFSERYGTILNVKSSGPNHYYVEKPDGRSTEYYFKNGFCQKVVVDNFFATFTFERAD